jgi:hypothetical protein
VEVVHQRPDQKFPYPRKADDACEDADCRVIHAPSFELKDEGDVRKALGQTLAEVESAKGGKASKFGFEKIHKLVQLIAKQSSSQ